MNVAKIYRCDLANGEGIRVSLFVTGCKFHCKGCFNEKCQDFSVGKLYDEDLKQLILSYVKDERVDGLSLLGGDPLWQDEEGLNQLIDLCKEVHILGKSVWLWSGFTYKELKDSEEHIDKVRLELVRNCDCFIEGRFVEELKDLSLPWMGSSNQRLLTKLTSIDGDDIV